MATLASKVGDLEAALEALTKQHKVPGASLGVLQGDEVIEVATGVANKHTGVPVTTRTLFQIGSNTKVYTATLVMQLVDDGLIDLDAPVKKYIRDLELADKKVRDTVTVRQLLTHTSGIEGDYFDAFGRGDDGIEKYVRSFKTLGNIYAPGEMWSYCNSGWTLLGYLVEKLRGETYAKALRERLLTPIGANATTVLMEEMLRESCAVGHMVLPGASDAIVPPVVMMSPSHAPAGSMTSSTAGEVLRFVRLHLDGGRTKDATQILSTESVRAMQQPQAKLPRSSLGSAMGLGWILSDWDGERVIGHGGGTIGQLSFLQVLPDRPFAVVLLTNCTTGGALWQDLSRYVFEEFAGVRTPELPKAPEIAPKLDLAKYTGTYRRLGLDLEVELRDGALVATTKGTGEMSRMQPTMEVKVRPIDKELFLANMGGADTIAHFIDFDRSGRPTFLHVGGRVSRRVDAGGTTARATKPKAKARAKPKAKARKKTAARKRR